MTAIAGIDRVLMRFAGRADHAGTMPMKDRHDALLAAAEAMLQVERVACGAPIHGVGTSGRLESEPGAPNVVPGSATVWSEIRSTDPVWLGMAQRQLVADIADIAAKRGVEVDTTVSSDQPPATAAQAMQDRVAAAADALGFCWAAVPSGAGHDAAHLAHLGPMGMIFVPSVAGRSHVPEEYTDINDIVRGVHTLTATILAGDAS